jgi:starvation-inducible DNA-binding protein
MQIPQLEMNMANVSKLAPRVAPPSLDTPNDIRDEGVAAISEAVNGLVADSFALYVKTKNFHWHMSGPHFRDYHLLLDEQGQEIYAAIDPLAERVRKLGGTTIRSIGDIQRLQSIADNDAEFVGPRDMLRELVADNKQMIKNMRAAHQVCDEHEDLGTASLLEELIDQAEKRTWFLFEASRDADQTGH